MNRRQANLEEEHRLHGATSWQQKLPPAAESIGDSLQRYLDSRKIFFRKTSDVVDAWKDVLPPVLANFCRLKEYKQGMLIVEVPPGPYLQQMHMIRQDLLRELKRRCPRSGLKQITLIPLSINQE